MSNQIYQEVTEIERINEDIRELVKQSRELSLGIETIKKRIESYEKIQKTQKELSETCAKCHQLVFAEQQKDDIVIDE